MIQRCILFRQRPGQHRDIRLALAQRWDFQWIDGQTIIQVSPETTFGDGLLQVHIGRRHQPYIDLAHLVVTQPLDFTGLQYTQQLGLGSRRHFAQLVQKQRAAISPFELTGT